MVWRRGTSIFGRNTSRSSPTTTRYGISDPTLRTYHHRDDDEHRPRHLQLHPGRLFLHQSSARQKSLQYTQRLPSHSTAVRASRGDPAHGSRRVTLVRLCFLPPSLPVRIESWLRQADELRLIFLLFTPIEIDPPSTCPAEPLRPPDGDRVGGDPVSQSAQPKQPKLSLPQRGDHSCQRVPYHILEVVEAL
jgi:hypothetical protein